MKKYLLVAIAPLLLLLGSCTGSSQKEQEQIVPSDTIVEPDTLSIEQQVADWEANDTLYHAFLDADEALLYMEKSSHAKQYKEGILPRMACENLPYCERLMNNRFDYFIVVDKASMRVLLYNRYGVKEKEYTCACALKQRKATAVPPKASSMPEKRSIVPTGFIRTITAIQVLFGGSMVRDLFASRGRGTYR